VHLLEPGSAEEAASSRFAEWRLTATREDSRVQLSFEVERPVTRGTAEEYPEFDQAIRAALAAVERVVAFSVQAGDP
jgi:hypothetical protein